MAARSVVVLFDHIIVLLYFINANTCCAIKESNVFFEKSSQTEVKVKYFFSARYNKSLTCQS